MVCEGAAAMTTNEEENTVERWKAERGPWPAFGGWVVKLIDPDGLAHSVIVQGDAEGFDKPTTGEDVAQSLIDALAAADALVDRDATIAYQAAEIERLRGENERLLGRIIAEQEKANERLVSAFMANDHWWRQDESGRYYVGPTIAGDGTINWPTALSASPGGADEGAWE